MKKNILIYGANSLISFEIIKLIHKDCKNLYLFSRNKAMFKNKFYYKSYPRIKFMSVNILDKKKNFVLFKKIKGKLDGVIWVAGETGSASLEFNNPTLVEQNIKLNFLNPVIFINYLIKKLRKNNKSFLVFITSVAGLRGRKKNMFYGSAKAGAISYMSGLRQKFNNQLKIITVIPGYIKTNNFNIKCSKFLVSSPKFVAKKIVAAINNHTEVVYVSFIWKIIMILIKFIPEKIFKKLNF